MKRISLSLLVAISVLAVATCATKNQETVTTYPACEKLFSDWDSALSEVYRTARPGFSSGDLARALHVDFQYKGKFHKCLAQQRVISNRCSNQLGPLIPEGTSFSTKSQTNCRLDVLNYIELERPELEYEGKLGNYRSWLIRSLVAPFVECEFRSSSCSHVLNTLTEIVADKYNKLKANGERTSQSALNLIWYRYIDPLLNNRSYDDPRPTELACAIVERLKENHKIDVTDSESITFRKRMQQIELCNEIIEHSKL